MLWFKSERPWFNLEAGTSFFEGDSAFQFLNLSKTTRFYGFVSCVVIGFILSLLGTIVLIFGQLVLFAVLYVLGTIVTLISTGFLLGFFTQLKLMFKPIRVVASIVFIASVVVVLVGAFVLSNGTLCLIFVVAEFLAYTWYSLSYIPYARAGAAKLFGFG